ncbi:MAG TPA: hypothetical protein DCS93_07895 [Microscillaceae bacterium]|nr:hypothetical protein [Microscillaceae bacterium]
MPSISNSTKDSLAATDKSFETNSNNKGIVSAHRDPVDLELEVLSGTLPEDIYGHMFFITQVGTVNSGGLPIPQTYPDGSLNKEYGSPVMNGDGYVYRVDFDQAGKVMLKGRLLKTPCYYADEATKHGSPVSSEGEYKGWGFHNMGISRLSYELGMRNEVNTAVIPAKFDGDQNARFFATYDVGRPFEFNPETLELKTPVGHNKIWTPGTPGIINLPFAIVQTTAHPVFDAATKDFFLVNFTKSTKTMLSSVSFLEKLAEDEKLVEQRLEKVIEEAKQLNSKEAAAKRVNDFFHNIEKELLDEVESTSIWKKLSRFFKWIWKKIKSWFKKETETEDEVYLMKWQGQEEINKWKLIDQDNNTLVIPQCMHQITLTEDYVVLLDNSFKFTLDILINDPFPHNPTISAFIREILAAPMLPYVDVYIVPRANLDPSQEIVRVKKLKQPVPLECVHLSSNYANKSKDGSAQNEITLYMAHNSAACMAEWLRSYDKLGINSTEAVDPYLLGLFAVGGMDIGRMGKVVIDVDNAEINQDKTVYLSETGNLNDLKNVGAHTWELGLYTFRDLISPNTNIDYIQDMYYVCYGADPRMLTEFIKKLYDNYKNRKIPVADIIKYTSEGIPPVITRLNTDTMKLEDFYQLEMNYNLRSIQFCPKRRANPADSPVPLTQDGYVVCTLINPINDEGNTTYRREIWIFDGANLAQGPVCVLGADTLDYTFPLHSLWVEDIQNNISDYNINIRDDYNEVIDTILLPWRREKMQKFFDQYVYPHFD